VFRDTPAADYMQAVESLSRLICGFERNITLRNCYSATMYTLCGLTF
jgi:hypothetical protein